VTAAYDLGQPILVPRAGTHERTVAAVALASRLAFHSNPTDPAWERWMGRPAKTVRKAKATAHVEQVLAWAREAGAPHAYVDGVLALAPHRPSELPARVRGAQVQGVDFARLGEAPRSRGGPQVFILDSLSTGKAGAQAAHALWGWALRHPQWHPREGITVEFAGPARLDAAAGDGGAAAVHDAGLTEVAPGTLTAVALLRG